jgi:hypothetical protein
MNIAEADAAQAGLDLPSAYNLIVPPAEMSAHQYAMDQAEDHGAGTLVWTPRPHVLEFAVMLAPEEPLRSARRALFLCMSALADALASVCPPEKRISFGWPDTILYDGARLGGGRLGWPAACGEDDVPAWLVFSAMLIASKRETGDPGLTPDSTSLEEERCLEGSQGELVELFARYLLLGFDGWADQGFAPAAERYLYRLAAEQSGTALIEENGDLLITQQGGAAAKRWPLREALLAPAWLDVQTGRPRL